MNQLSLPSNLNSVPVQTKPSWPATGPQETTSATGLVSHVAEAGREWRL
jgi:hypothetical protein